MGDRRIPRTPEPDPSGYAPPAESNTVEIAHLNMFVVFGATNLTIQQVANMNRRVWKRRYYERAKQLHPDKAPEAETLSLIHI